MQDSRKRNVFHKGVKQINKNEMQILCSEDVICKLVHSPQNNISKSFHFV